MKTKIVTALWLDVAGYPFQGASSVRKDRYYGSLISHCRGINFPVVCYTHEKNKSEIEKLKLDYNLSNLEIKILELSDMKYHKKIKDVRDKNFDTDLDGRGPEIMWGKFQVLEQELEGFDRVYWVDGGLQHPGIFPWMYCVPYGDKKFHNPNEVPVWNNNQISQYDFTKLFNTELFIKMNEISENKVLNLTATNPQSGYVFKTKGIIDYDIRPYYPIAGMIGGDIKQLKNYINEYWNFCDKIIDKEFLCTEESIMKLVYDKLKDIVHPLIFDVHQTDEHDQYHFELWDPSWGKPKPLYMVWIDILNS